MLIVCFHLGILFHRVGLPTFGLFGIDLFFVLSGFVMIESTRNGRRSPRSFLARRVIRVVPAYWLATGLVLSYRGISGHSTSISAILKALFFIPTGSPERGFVPVLQVGWTLNYEMAFYVLFAGALGFAGWLTTRLTVADGKASSRTWILAVAAPVVFGLVTAVVFGRMATPPSNSLAAFFTDPLVLDFALGVLAAVAIGRTDVEMARRWAWPASAVAASSFLAVLCEPDYQEHLLRLALIGVPCALVVAALAVMERSGLRIRRPWLLGLGDASYSIYLIHLFVTERAIHWAKGSDLGFAATIALVGSAIAASCLAGLIFHRAVERPITAWLGSKRGSDSRAPASP